MKDKLTEPLIGKRPASTIWLDRRHTLLYTGKRVDRETASVLDAAARRDGIEKTYLMAEALG